mmetsp:Transcript_75906/g.131533  ORF Transcript_75906/g.131533 Transcript_75906/m.131533 type:complete len:104 (+) Transcript_75906:1-312(+)
MGIRPRVTREMRPRDSAKAKRLQTVLEKRWKDALLKTYDWIGSSGLMCRRHFQSADAALRVHTHGLPYEKFATTEASKRAYRQEGKMTQGWLPQSMWDVMVNL